MRRRLVPSSQSGWRGAIDLLESRLLFSAPTLPVIPAGTFLITTYGATTTSSNNATQIQAAITAAKNAGGGTVEIPAGTWFSGPITLASKINFQVDAGATLQAVSMANYPNNTSPANFITISSLSNVEISGSGTIDGNGADWWTAYNNSGGTISRPRIINASGSNNAIWIRNVRLQNSPQFNLAMSGSNNVTIDGITIFNPTSPSGNISPNTDGIDMGGSHWLIQNCTIDTGDDNIVAKPGSTFCTDMTVTNCTFLHGHGLSIGGQTGKGLDGLTVTNCTFNGTTTGIRMKCDRNETSKGGGGLVTNCTYTNITMTNVQYPININSYYSDGTIPKSTEISDTAQPIVKGTTPFWQNITISNLTSTGSSSYAGIIWGLPEAPVLNVTLKNVKISATNGFEINHAHNISFDSSCAITQSSGNKEIQLSGSSAAPLDSTIVKDSYTPVSSRNDTVTGNLVDESFDIGSPSITTNSTYIPDTDTWTVVAAGSGISGTSDQFNLDSQSMTGNVLASTRVTGLTPSGNASADAGVIIRDGTATGGMFAAAVEQPNKQVMFVYRAATGGSVVSSSLVGDTTNAKYLKINRIESTFTAWYSTNGTSWTQIASPVSIAMPSTARAGLCATSTNASSASTATFTGATVINDNTPPTVTDKSYLYSTSLNKLSFTFSEDVSASLSTSDLSVVTVPPGGGIGSAINVTGMTYDTETNTATLTLATPLADGNYLATLSGSSTTDVVGNTLQGGDASLPFFVLPGDVDRDGVVNALDFNVLATNFGQSASFAQGDFDFNGSIGTGDFIILAANFGVNLNPTGAQSLAANPSAPAGLFSAGPSVTLADQIFDPLSLAGNAL